jgi:hypothetical protein
MEVVLSDGKQTGSLMKASTSALSRLSQSNRVRADVTDKVFDEPILLIGYLALFSSRLIIEFKAIPRRGQFAPGDAKFDAGISIA